VFDSRLGGNGKHGAKYRELKTGRFAKQTCPPHYWLIDSQNIGRCKKCGEKRDFGKALKKEKLFHYYPQPKEYLPYDNVRGEIKRLEER
jgi:hypothetical protein